MTQLAATTTSTSQPIGPIDRKLADAVAAILNTSDRVGDQTIARYLPSPALKRDIELRQSELRRSLAPLERSIAEKERAAKAVAAVLSGWVNAKVSDPAAKVSAYLAILGDLPCWVVEQVCREVARGHVDGLDPDFPPSAARLHQLGEDVIERLRREAAALDAVKNARLTPEAQPTEAERDRIRFGFQKLSEELQAAAPAGKPEAERQKIDPAAFAKAQGRVRSEYAALGSTPPSPLALSPTALKVMRDIDAERNRALPMDEAAE